MLFIMRFFGNNMQKYLALFIIPERENFVKDRGKLTCPH